MLNSKLIGIFENYIFIKKRLKGSLIKIKHNEIFIDELIKNILEIAEERKLKVVPIYPRITKFFRKNKSYKDLLPPGIRI